MGRDNKQETTIYWAATRGSNAETYDLNHLYPEVRSLYEEIVPRKVSLKDNLNDFLRCPAFSDLAKNTFVHRAPVDTRATLDFDRKRASHIFDNQLDKNKFQVRLDFMREPTIEGHNLIQYNWPVVFFSEEDSMMATLTAPYFERTTSSQYGVVVPGRFDIGKWFRPMNMEFQLWEGVSEIRVAAGEALCYLHFDTDKKITLRRFIMNRELDRIVLSTLKVSPFRRFARLSDRYGVFERSQSKQRVLKLIRQQIV